MLTINNFVCCYYHHLSLCMYLLQDLAPIYWTVHHILHHVPPVIVAHLVLWRSRHPSLSGLREGGQGTVSEPYCNVSICFLFFLSDKSVSIFSLKISINIWLMWSLSWRAPHPSSAHGHAKSQFKRFSVSKIHKLEKVFLQFLLDKSLSWYIQPSHKVDHQHQWWTHSVHACF